jgi:hypothetical protein
VPFNIEVMPMLRAAIDAMPPSNHMTFLVTARVSHSPQPGSETTSGTFATRPDCRSVARLTVCERPQQRIWQRWAPPTIN